MRNPLLILALLAALLAAPPLAAHAGDPVTQAQRVGRWLQLDHNQVEQLAVFFTQTKLQRQTRRQAIKPELLALLDQAQKARLAELMVSRELRMPRRGANSDQARLDHLRQALSLSPGQVNALQQRMDALRAENQQLRAQREQELAAIIGVDNANRLIERLEQRRARPR